MRLSSPFGTPDVGHRLKAGSHKGGGFVVALRHVRKTFATGTVALDNFDLDVRDGEFLTLLGPSGCGKSTVLRLIAGLSRATSGEVEWRDAAPMGHGAPDLGFVFQEPTLMPWATVSDNVRLPFKLAGTEPDT